MVLFQRKLYFSKDPEGSNGFITEKTILFRIQRGSIIIPPANFVFIPPANFVCGGVYCFHVVRPSVRLCVRPSVTFCFLNNLKSNCWIFIKLCKNIHICKTNTLNKKVRARGQFY